MVGLERIWNEWQQPEKSKHFKGFYKKAIDVQEYYGYITPIMALFLDGNYGEYEIRLQTELNKEEIKTMKYFEECLKKEQYKIGKVDNIVKEARENGYNITKKIKRYLYVVNDKDFHRTFDIRLADMIDRVLGDSTIYLLGESPSRPILLTGSRGFGFVMPTTHSMYDDYTHIIKVV